MRITLHGRPTPKARPRPGARGRYYVPSQAEQEALALSMRQYRGKFIRGDLLSVTIEFHFDGGARPGDIDNLEKLVLDAMQDAEVFPNDMQIVHVEKTIIRPARTNKTVIEVKRLRDRPVSRFDRPSD
jgi:Holliday junction resolvase RusA-like endonuclease